MLGTAFVNLSSLHHHQSKLFQREFQNLRARFCQEMNSLVLLQQRPQHMHHFNYTSAPIKMDPPFISLKLMYLSINLKPEHSVYWTTGRTAISQDYTQTPVQIQLSQRPEGLFFPWLHKCQSRAAQLKPSRAVGCGKRVKVLRLY